MRVLNFVFFLSCFCTMDLHGADLREGPLGRQGSGVELALLGASRAALMQRVLARVIGPQRAQRRNVCRWFCGGGCLGLIVGGALFGGSAYAATGDTGLTLFLTFCGSLLFGAVGGLLGACCTPGEPGSPISPHSLRE